MAMATLFSDTSIFFSRSRSSSKLSSLNDPVKSTQPNIQNDELPRSASVASFRTNSSLSVVLEKESTETTATEIRDALSEEVFSNRQSRSEIRETGNKQSSSRSSSKDVRSKFETPGRRKSIVGSLMKKVRATPERSLSAEAIPKLSAAYTSVPINTTSKVKDLSAQIASNGQAWPLSPSRSPSPERVSRDDSSRDDDASTAASSVSSSSTRRCSPVRSKSVGPHARSLSPALELLRKSTLRKNKTSVMQSEVAASPVKTIDQKVSVAGTPSLTIPPSPKVNSKDRPTISAGSSFRKKDELWSVFRALENDFQKFSSKASGPKVAIVRLTLIPFLRSHVNHAANKNVLAEDLERRVFILNKWWAGLAEMLQGSGHIPGSDRPVVFEAIIGIMTRPEWRQGSTDFAPLHDRLPTLDGEFKDSGVVAVAESVHENVRALFVRNLLAQMNIVVERMSQKNAPSSLVTFCGKAIAYAFFFCPGVADVLVKIWSIQPDILRRVVDEFGLSRQRMPGHSTALSTQAFPANLHNFAWKSLRDMLTQLRQQSVVPLAASNIDWHGSWVSRWTGRDSDLFFVFCKHYHFLLEEFLGPGMSLEAKARSPCFVLVQCQLLVSLNTTIHRQPGSDHAIGAPPATFDELLKGIDTAAGALPLPMASNAARLMSENRLVMLLRDCLAEKAAEQLDARRTIAESFSRILHLAVRKTSQFNHNACFVLCDFLDEVLPIYMRFEKSQDSEIEYVDWGFWMQVCKSMMDGQNSMIEIRVLSLLYGSWNLICEDDHRKKSICLDWLLCRTTFETFFLHWCPMVRAYYMRLLCWRLCRFTGDASPLDTQIYSALHENCKLVWASYLYLKQKSSTEKRPLPSTAACLPAPGRRLLIIRVDTQAAAAELIASTDSLKVNSSTPVKPRLSSVGKTSSAKAEAPHLDMDKRSSKRWSVLGKTNPNNMPMSPGHERHQSTPPPKEHNIQVGLIEESHSSPSPSRRPALNNNHYRAHSSPDSSPPSSPGYRAYSFKFSLEWNITPPSHSHLNQNMSAFTSSGRPKSTDNAGWGLERRLNQPRIPTPAYSWLVSQVPSTAMEVQPRQPSAEGLSRAKYAGRALAEWSLVVMECNNFTQRRIAEGVPYLKNVEIPVMGVDGFKKFN